MRVTDPEQASDLVHGLAFLGTGGGGGRLQDGLDMLLAAIEAGEAPELVTLDELPDDGWTAAIASLAGRDPDAPPSLEELAQYGLEHERFGFVERFVRALQGLEADAGLRLVAVVSSELGSANTAAAMVAAARMGLPTVNGDYVGRAIPEFAQTKAEIFGMPFHPAALADRWGNLVILKEATSAMMADRIGRMVSVAAYGGGVGTAGYLYQVRDARRIVVPETLSRALEIGRAIRVGQREGNAVETVVRAAGGWRLLEGEALATEWHSEAAFTWRVFDYLIRGTVPDQGHDFRIWVKNEQHLSWRDGEVLATSPDLIVVVDAETAVPLTTRGDVSPGRRVAVIGLPTLDPAWRTPKGLELLGPRHFGFDIDYVPIEERMAGR